MTEPANHPPTPASASATPVPPAVGAPADACQNCGTALLGPHCYACGQPVKGLVRHFSSIIGDFLDSVLNLDTRIVRTLGPLFVRPGWLTCEYFEGRRVRYVSPVRLFFFLSIVTFFVAQFMISFDRDDIQIGGGDSDAIGAATTVAEVEQRRDAALADLSRARAETETVPGADGGLQAARATIRETAAARIEALREAQARGLPPPPMANTLTFGSDGPWDPEKNPIAIGWLPGFANAWLNAQAARANANIGQLRTDPDRYKNALLGAIPSTLFLLLPVFALMLKLVYAFKRRLYMEHLIVALHSHAFLCLSLLLVMLVLALRDWLAPAPGALHAMFGWIEGLLFAWMPVYLLLMQKRVYRQGWPMTLFKYCAIGISYFVLLTFGAVFTMLASLVWM